ncbi:hypothetical protein [Streptomyces sp. NPDC001380]|uniref:hypothetical protein n=1 Tax=Streptomyces sp. NPDC001380 TaxID=3364566 RepID=UPI003697AF59
MLPDAAPPPPPDPAPAAHPGPPADDTAVRTRVPLLAPGTELHGQYEGSGFTEARYLANRGDGQPVMLSRLLYLVASALDGVRDYERVSHHVSGRYGREVSTSNIAFLVERKLVPLGVAYLPEHGEAPPPVPKTDLLLALKGHKVLLPPRAVLAVADALSWLHRPAAVTAALLSVAVLDAWLFLVHGAMTPVLHTMEQPVLLLAVFALTVGSLLFHEFGHASACRYGGARPGCIGCGVYLIWPALYTDVTDIYRRGRGARLRTDTGGIYFNAVFVLGLFAGYFATGQEFLLAAVYLVHFEALEQLMPAVRLDGYYILGDLAGIPDLFGKVRPILSSMVPGRPLPREVRELKKSARVIVTAWVVTMVPLIVAELSYALWNLPRLVSTAVRSLTEQVRGTAEALREGALAQAALGTVGSLLLVLPMGGVVYLTFRIGGRLYRAGVQATAGRPAARLAVVGCVAAVAAALAGAWTYGMTPKTLPPKPPLAPALQPNVPRPQVHATAPARHRHRHHGPAASPTAVPGRPSGSPSARVPLPVPSSPSPRASTGSPRPSADASSAVPSARTSPSSTPSFPGGSATPSPSASPSEPVPTTSPRPTPPSGTPSPPTPGPSPTGLPTATATAPTAAGG